MLLLLLIKRLKYSYYLRIRRKKILFLQQYLQQASANREAEEKLEKLQQDFQQMQLGYQSSLAEKEHQLQMML